MKVSTKTSIWLVITGIVFIIFGIVVLAYPGITLASLAIVLGCGILMTGILQLVSYFSNKSEIDSNWVLVAGILDTVIGLFLLLNIAPTALALPFIVGFWAIFTSISRLAASFSIRKLGFRNWWIVLITGILGLILAGLIIYYPAFGALVITAYISVFLLFLGVMSIAEAYLVKKTEL